MVLCGIKSPLKEGAKMKRFLAFGFFVLLVASMVHSAPPPMGGGGLPSQTGKSGKYLTTDGSSASWDTPAGSGDMLAADWADGGLISTDKGGTEIDSSSCTTGAYVDAGAWGCDNATKARRLSGLAIGTNIPSLTAPVFATSVESPFFIVGSAATAADAGGVRFPNASNLAWEIAATGTDATFGVDGSDDMVAGLVAATDLFNITTGNLKVGNGTPAHTLDGEDAYVEGNVEILGNIYQTNSANDVDVAGRIIGRSATLSFAASATSDTEPPKLDFWRALAASAAVVDTSVLGGIYFRGQTSDGIDLGASIVATVSGTPGNDDVPTKLDIFTALDGSATPATGLSIDKGVSTFNGNVLVTGGQFRLPSSNADNTAAAGYIRHDSTVTNHANGALRWHDGTNIRHVIDMVAATAEGCTDGYAVVYDAGADLFKCAAAAGGAGDIESVFSCTTGACPTLTAGAADVLNMTDGNYSIPMKVSTDCSGTTGEGRMCYESDAEILWVGDNTAPKIVSRTLPIVTVSSSRSITTAEMNGGFLNVTGAYTATLPDCSATTLGISGTFNATTAAIFILETDGTDAIVLRGTALTAGNVIDSDGYAGTQVEVVCTEANKWTTRHMVGLFSDGGAT